MSSSLRSRDAGKLRHDVVPLVVTAIQELRKVSLKTSVLDPETSKELSILSDRLQEASVFLHKLSWELTIE